MELRLSAILERRGLGLRRRLHGIELAVAFFDAASALVSGDGDADMVGANPFACSGDFLLRLAICQGKDLIAEARRGRTATGWFCGCAARSTTRLSRSGRLAGRC